MLAIDIDITSITLICITLLSITLTSITLIIIMAPLLSKEGKGSASKEEAKEPASKHIRHVVLLVRHSGDRGHHHHLRRCGAFVQYLMQSLKRDVMACLETQEKKALIILVIIRMIIIHIIIRMIIIIIQCLAWRHSRRTRRRTAEVGGELEERSVGGQGGTRKIFFNSVFKCVFLFISTFSHFDFQMIFLFSFLYFLNSIFNGVTPLQGGYNQLAGRKFTSLKKGPSEENVYISRK